jgi:branched-chain amino acid transport system permease protein
MSRARWLLLILLPVLLLGPRLLSSYYVQLASLILVWALFAMSLDLLVGFAGLPSLGHSTFFGFAAYVVAITSVRYLHSFWAEMLLSMVLTTCTAAVIAPLALRARGVYFLMITLAMAQIAWGIAFGWRSMTGGNDGIRGIPNPELGAVTLDDPWAFYYLALAIAGVATGGMYVFSRSPLGRVLVGIRENETRMNAMGYNVWLYKYAAFIAAAFFASIAGGLYAFQNRFVSTAALGVVPAAEAFLMVVLGGTGTLFGPVIGAAAIVLLKNIMSGFTDRWPLLLGLVYVGVVMFAPNGVLVLARDRLKGALWQQRRESAERALSPHDL